MTESPTHAAIRAVFRIESARLVAGLGRIVRDVGLADDTDWARIAALYAELGALAASPVVELNRAMAVAMAEGPAAGLAIIDALSNEPALQAYHLLAGARGDLLERLGRFDEARAELERAAALTQNMREREQLHARAARCVARSTAR